MICPECGDPDSDVVDSRATGRGNYTRRRRVCGNGHKFTTYERIGKPIRNGKTEQELFNSIRARLAELSQAIESLAARSSYDEENE